MARDGTRIGRVEDVEVDPGTWRVTALSVDVRRAVLERLQIDEPIIAGSKLLMLDPAHITEITDRIHLRDDLWDVGRMRFR